MRMVKHGSGGDRRSSAAADSSYPGTVDLDPTVPETPPEPEGPAKILKPAAVPDWRGSSWDLLNGVEITDETDSIPGELFDSLFRR
jgi:hypothetical protein